MFVGGWLSNCQVASEIRRCNVDEIDHIYDTYMLHVSRIGTLVLVSDYVVLWYWNIGKYIPWVRVEVEWKGDFGWASL